MAVDVAQLNSIVKNDPEIQRLLGLYNSGDTSETKGVFDNPSTKIMDRLKQLGVDIPKGMWLSDGEIQKNPNTFLTKALPIIAGAATLGIGLGAMGPGAAFLTGGGGSAAGATGAASAAGTGTAASVPALASGIPSAIGGASALTPSAVLGGSIVPEAGFAPWTSLSGDAEAALNGASPLASTSSTGLASLPSAAPSSLSSSSGASLADRLVSGAKKAAPLLSSMASSAQSANQKRDEMLPSVANAQLARDKFALDAPSVRMGQTAKAAAVGSAAPLVRNWGGPGSGMTPGASTSTGGAGASIPAVQAASKPLTDDIIHQNLMNQLAHKDDQSPLDQFGKTSVWDKLLGGAAIGTNLLDFGKKKTGVMT